MSNQFDKPSDEQLDFVSRANAAKPGQVIILTGEGGSGKTHCLGYLSTMTQRKVKYLTPTHEAKAVLIGKLRRLGVQNPDVDTIASFLEKRPNRDVLPDADDLFGQEFQDNGGGLSIALGEILAIDESSMLTMLDLIALTHLANRGLMVICGDFKQLPPVKAESIFSALMNGVSTTPQTVEMVELKKNRRAKSDKLVNFLNTVRSTGQFPADVPDDGSVTYVRDRQTFIQMWKEALIYHGRENVLYLAYKNATVDNATAVGRAALGHSGNFYEKGEILRVDKPYKFLEWCEAHKIAGSDDYDAIKEVMAAHTVNTGDRVKILSVDARVTMMKYEWVPGVEVPTKKCTARALTGACEGTEFEMTLVEVGSFTDKTSLVWELLRGARAAADAADRDVWGGLTPEQANAVRKAMRHLNPQKVGVVGTGYWNGRLFSSVREEFMKNSSALALTVHKAQGTGIDHVFVDARDIGGPDAAELRYTAASRAQAKLVVLL